MRWMWAIPAVAMASSCATVMNAKAPLRVGVTPNYPPIIQLQDGKAAGAECDFAVQLAKELERPLELVSVPWESQLDELETGGIDIVMSGMTITPARKARVAFCDSYMSNPLIAVVRRGESGRYPTAAAVVGATGGLCVLQKTSADAFVRRQCKNAKILPLASRDDVVFYLANQRIELYIDDLAAVANIVSRNEERLELVRIPLEPQELAWAVRASDAELKGQANAALARWRANGLLDRILDRWMPYRPALLAAGAAR